MALSTFFADPFFTEAERNFDRAVHQAFRSEPLAVMNSLARSAPRHAVDVIETKDAFKMVTDAPGFSPEEIKVELHEGRLTVLGERNIEKAQTDKDGKYHVQERQFTRFTRQFQLPANVAEDQIAANLEKGVLTVTVPKVPEPPKPEPKRIQVTSAL